jgi:hypothetical protein
MKRRHSSVERGSTPVVPLQQQQPNSPRAGSQLPDQQPYSPPRTASTVAVALSWPVTGPPQPAEQSGYTITGQTGPGAALAQPDFPAATTGARGMQQQQQQAVSSRPGSNLSHRGASSSITSRSSSRGSSRGVSRDVYPQISADGDPPAAGLQTAAPMQQQMQQQQLVDGRSQAWPPMPSSAGLQQAREQGQQYEAAPSYGSGGGGGAVQQWSGAGGTPSQLSDAGSGGVVGPPQRRVSGGTPAPPPVQLSAAQRFRQARANQVVPIPEEYLSPANMPVQE